MRKVALSLKKVVFYKEDYFSKFVTLHNIFNKVVQINNKEKNNFLNNFLKHDIHI